MLECGYFSEEYYDFSGDDMRIMDGLPVPIWLDATVEVLKNRNDASALFTI